MSRLFIGLAAWLWVAGSACAMPPPESETAPMPPPKGTPPRVMSDEEVRQLCPVQPPLALDPTLASVKARLKTLLLFREGKVVVVEIDVIESDPDRKLMRKLKQSIDHTLRAYQCKGSGQFVREIRFG